MLGTTTEGEVSADDLTIATSGATGITIRSGTSNSGNLYFSDGTSSTAEYAGFVQYDHANDILKLGAAASEIINIHDEYFKIKAVEGTNRLYFGFTDSAGGELSLYDAAGSQKTRLTGHVGDLNFINNGGTIGIDTSLNNSSDCSIEADVSMCTAGVNLASHGINFRSGKGGITAVHEQVFPITAGFQWTRSRPRAGIGFISQKIGTSENGGGAFAIYTRSAADGTGLTNADERLRVDKDGRIGIGNTVPQVLLDIVDSAVTNSDRNGDDKITVENNGTTNINLISAADNSGFLLFSDDTRAQGYVKYDHSLDDLCLSASDDVWVRTNGSESLRIGSDGNTTAQSLTLNDNGATGTILLLTPDDEAPWAFHLRNDTYSTGNEGLKMYQSNA